MVFCYGNLFAEMVYDVSKAPMIEASKHYSVNQYNLLGDLHSDMLTMFQGDSILRYFCKLFDDKAVSLSLSGDREVMEGMQ